MSVTKNKETDYEVLLRNVKKETTAKGKCQWIAAILELIITNDLHALFCGQQMIKKALNRFTFLLAAVLILVLVTNPQVTGLALKLLNMVF